MLNFLEKLNCFQKFDTIIAAGTGIYAFWLADKGHEVTATDITPRHINIINEILKNKNYTMNTAVLGATESLLLEENNILLKCVYK